MNRIIVRNVAWNLCGKDGKAGMNELVAVLEDIRFILTNIFVCLALMLIFKKMG